jgi:hypothetical protein
MRCYAPKQNFQINLHFTTFFHLHHFSNMVYNRNQQGMYQNLIQVHKIKKSVTDLFSKTKSWDYSSQQLHVTTGEVIDFPS